ncbi:hypothetical protein [Nitrosopumilus sp.]
MNKTPIKSTQEQRFENTCKYCFKKFSNRASNYCSLECACTALGA